VRHEPLAPVHETVVVSPVRVTAASRCKRPGKQRLWRRREPGAAVSEDGPSAFSGLFGTSRAGDVTTRTDDVILVIRDGAPADFYLPWDTPDLPVEVRREVFLRLSEQIGTQLTDQGTIEEGFPDDFAAGRRRR
jgi:hypothetical protein